MRYLIVTIFVLFSFQAWGEVGGWKDFKFGMKESNVKNVLIRLKNNKKLLSGCNFNEELNLEYFRCFKIGNLVVPKVKFSFYGGKDEDELDTIFLTFEGKKKKTQKIKTRLLNAYSKKYKLFGKEFTEGSEQFLFANGHIYIWQDSNSFSVIYFSEEGAERNREELTRNIIIDDTFTEKLEFEALGVKLGMKDSDAKKLLPDAKIMGEGKKYIFVVKDIHYPLAEKGGILIYEIKEGIVDEIIFIVTFEPGDTPCINMTHWIKNYFIDEFKVKYNKNDIQSVNDTLKNNAASIEGDNGIFRIKINNSLKSKGKSEILPNSENKCVIGYEIDEYSKKDPWFSEEMKKGLQRTL